MKNNYTIKGEVIEIDFTNRKNENFKLLIDYEDLEKVQKYNLSWNAVYMANTDSYYARATQYNGTVDGKPKYKMVYLHRLIMDVLDSPQDYVDHMNHNTLDNRKFNLRIVSNNVNLKNRGKNSNNKSGYRNVCWVYNKWIVQLQINGKSTILGKFDDVDEAGRYAEKMRKKYYKDIKKII